MNKPNTDLLGDLFHSELWGALKTEIEMCRNNSLFRLKREGEANREYQAGAVWAYEVILNLEEKYKNLEIKNESSD